MAEESSASAWLPDVILAFRAAGGTARFSQIYRWVSINRKGLPDEWEAAIRATVYHHSSDSPAFKKGDPDVFFKKAYGLWALRYPSETVLGKTDSDLAVQILKSMTKEELEAFSGKANELRAYMRQKIEEKKKQFRIE